MMHDKILQFISHFKGSEDVFLHGCCYWFAWMLVERFTDELSDELSVGYILYVPIEGHFIYGVCKADMLGKLSDDGFRYYDVRGDVTDTYKGKPMYTIRYMIDKMPKYYENLMRECRDFEEGDVDV